MFQVRKVAPAARPTAGKDVVPASVHISANGKNDGAGTSADPVTVAEDTDTVPTPDTGGMSELHGSKVFQLSDSAGWVEQVTKCSFLVCMHVFSLSVCMYCQIVVLIRKFLPLRIGLNKTVCCPHEDLSEEAHCCWC